MEYLEYPQDHPQLLTFPGPKIEGDNQITLDNSIHHLALHLDQSPAHHLLVSMDEKIKEMVEVAAQYLLEVGECLALPLIQEQFPLLLHHVEKLVLLACLVQHLVESMDETTHHVVELMAQDLLEIVEYMALTHNLEQFPLYLQGVLLQVE